MTIKCIRNSIHQLSPLLTGLPHHPQSMPKYGKEAKTEYEWSKFQKLFLIISHNATRIYKTHLIIPVSWLEVDERIKSKLLKLHIVPFTPWPQPQPPATSLPTPVSLRFKHSRNNCCSRDTRRRPTLVPEHTTVHLVGGSLCLPYCSPSCFNLAWPSPRFVFWSSIDRAVVEKCSTSVPQPTPHYRCVFQYFLLFLSNSFIEI